MANEIKLLGTSDERTTCDCCGKSNLKMTVALEVDGGVVHFGRDCAGRALLGKKSGGNSAIVEARARAVQFAKKHFGTVEDLKLSIAVWNKFGFSNDIKNGVIKFCGMEVVL